MNPPAPVALRAVPEMSDSDAEAAIRVLLQWMGEDPDREGLRDTPSRVVAAFREYFAGYKQDPDALLTRTFSETAGYDEMIVLRGIPFQSHCEHHLAPVIGRVWVAYIPASRVVGISKLARVVEAYAARLQIQERMTVEIADAIERVLKPRGVAVTIVAEHHCMSARGVKKSGADLVTSRLTGCFRDHPATRAEFLSIVNAG